MALTILNTGVNIATSAVSASSALPVNTAGVNPKLIRITATAAAYVRLGDTAPTAVSTDLLIQPGDAVVVSTGGRGFIAALQVAAAGIVQVSPVEDI